VAGDSFFITKDFDAEIVKTVLRRKWWVLLVSLMICTGIAFFILRYSKPAYESSMLIQLADSDQAKDLLDIENINSSNSNFNANVELLRSQLLFERALGKLKAGISYFQEGKILTKEKNTSSCFEIQAEELKDSSLINVPIFISLINNKIEFTYDHQNKTKHVKSLKNGHFVNEDFDVFLNVVDRSTLEKIVKKDKLFFVFNSIASLSSQFSSSLSVNPMDPNAQTIELRFVAYNPAFCADLLNSLTHSFFNFELDLKRKGNENVLRFIDQQLDSLSQELENSKDSLVFFQRQSNLADPEAIGSNLTENVIKLQDQLYEIEDELNGLNKVASKLTREPNRLEIYRLLPEMLGKSYQLSLSKQIEELYEMLERKENLLYSVTEENPEIKSLALRISLKAEGIRKTIAVSSSVSGEGKTFVSLNLAGIIAMSGKKTILIDLDLRKPKIDLALKASNKIGVSNALVNQKTWQECVHHSNVENLDFLTAGPAPPNPSELILSEKMANILAELGEIYDVILIDNPPGGVVSDGAQLLSKADIPIYVFKANYSRRSYAERVEELIDVQLINKLNIILKGEIRNRRSYGYNYAYYSDEPAPRLFFSRIFKL
jgi:capsular exopolysaccharide synthesis family protein